MCKLLRFLAFLLIIGSIPSLLWAQEPPTVAPSVPAFAGSMPEQAPAIALAHRLEKLKAAISSQNDKAIENARRDIEDYRRFYNILDIQPLVDALALWANQEADEGRAEIGFRTLDIAESWAPSHPTLLGARVRLLRSQGIQGWIKSVPDLISLTVIRLKHPDHRYLWIIQHAGILRVMASLLLWGWAIALSMRFRRVLRDLWEENLKNRGMSSLSAAIIGSILLTFPVLLGLDLSVVAVYWLILLAPHLSSVELRYTIAIMILQLVHPGLRIIEPWAARTQEPSIQALQMQPRPQMVTSRELQFLPKEDRDFLSGWWHLQQRQWDKAEEVFKGLGEHPEQGLVLNNLGVVQYQKGLKKEASELFDKANEKSPGQVQILLNQSLIAFENLDLDKGRTKQEEAGAANAALYRKLFTLNFSSVGKAPYPAPMPDTEARTQALRKAWIEATPILKGGSAGIDAPFLFGLALPLVGIAGLFLHIRHSSTRTVSTQCSRCGEPFRRTDSPMANVCQKCHHLFILKDGLHAESKKRKLDEVSEHQNGQMWIHRFLVILCPGTDLVFLGNTQEGFMEFLFWAFAMAMVFATGRSVRYPGEVFLEPMSLWIPIGVPLLILLFLRSWLKLLPRKA